MAHDKVLVTHLGDESFRKGACHAARWFLETTTTLATQGRSAEEIANHLTDLGHILQEWRNGTGKLPDGNPWDWSFKDLASAIKQSKED